MCEETRYYNARVQDGNTQHRNRRNHEKKTKQYEGQKKKKRDKSIRGLPLKDAVCSSGFEDVTRKKERGEFEVDEGLCSTLARLFL